MTARVRPALVVLAVSVVFVLLIGCANVANLFLSRGVSRQRELAVRTALGASRAQLAGNLLWESARFAAAGGVFGVVIAWMLLSLVPILAPSDFPRLATIGLDWTTVIFAGGSSVVAALAAGLAPAIRGTRIDVASALHPGDGGVAAGAGNVRAQRLRDALLVAQSAVATLLMIGAALLARSFVALTAVDPGYDAANVLIARVYPHAGTDGSANVRFATDLIDRLRAAPGVVAAGAGNMMPFNDSTWITSFDLPPSAGRGKPTKIRAVRYLITPGYAETLRLRLREGRLLTAADGLAGSLELMVNDEFVRQYLAAGAVAGRTFAGGPYKVSQFEIAGVVRNVLKDGNDTTPLPEVYSIATADRPIGDEIDVVLRMTGDPATGAGLLRSAVHDLDRGAAVGELIPLTARASAAAAQPRFAMFVLAAFATLALILASVGLYGMLSYAVARRQRELGVRAALGAGRRELMMMVAKEGIGRAAVGIAIGIVAALLTTGLMRTLLFGVSPVDAVAYLIAPAVLLPVALAASLGPAWRAAASDPAVVLRGE
jgi:predicted permease